ncbi:MAG: 5-(carboxyamino)imidazole ribonucleotide synthase [Thermomicrobiales bacterium]
MQRRSNRSRLGILGGGQLARMCLAPATALAVDVTVLCRDFDDPAAKAWADVMIGSPDDPDAVAAVAHRCEVVTFDHELVDTSIIRALEQRGYRFAPSAAVLTVAQSKVQQRQQFDVLGLPIPPYVVLEAGTGASEISSFAARHGWPLMLKADRGGYDGRGVWRVNDLAVAESIVTELHNRNTAVVLEEVMPLDIELAILVARRWNGELATYPLVETLQVDGMLRSLRAPAQVSQRLLRQAADIAREIASAVEVVGLLAVEFFVSREGLLVNEIATRPHNSGHYTIEGAATSQFEQHIRAVLDLPLGGTGLNAPHVATVNVIGAISPKGRAAALSVPGAHLHLYGKPPRPGRKLGHVTVTGDSREEVMRSATFAALALEQE